jgi:hypothetical protein
MKHVPEGWQYLWCEPTTEGCSCIGCVNFGAKEYTDKMEIKPLTKEEWIRWVRSKNYRAVFFTGTTANEKPDLNAPWGLVKPKDKP